MSSYLSSLLTTTTSRYNSLRRALLSDEADGDTEEDSHISRVLRAYYTEKGRPFPPWLPPDPKAPQPAATQFVTSSRIPQSQGPPGRTGGGLSDLWEAPQQQQPPPQETVSLRRAAVGRGRGLPSRSAAIDPYNAPESASQGRPLPSQKAGSYQNQFAQSASMRPAAEPSPPPSSGSGTSAQERLKARLWGSGRSSSPTQSGVGSPSPAPSSTSSEYSSRNPYERENSYPSSGRPNPPYPDSRSGAGPGQASGSDRWNGGQNKGPYVSANAPWSGGDDLYGGGGYGGSSRGSGQRPPGRDRVGLPNGPRLR